MPTVGSTFPLLVATLLVCAPTANALPAPEITLVADVLCLLPTLVTPSNDCFSKAPSLVHPTTVAGSSQGALVQTDEPRPCGAIGATVWYRLSGADADVVASTSGSAFDTVLAVHTGTSLASLETVACNDDHDGTSSRVSWRAEPSQTYWIQLGGTDSESGNYQLVLEQGAPAVACNDGLDNDGDNLADHPDDPGCESELDPDETDPPLPCASSIPNDCFWTAQPVETASSASGSTVGATLDPGEPTQCGATAATVWFRLTEASGAMVVDALNSSYDAVVVVYAGDWVDDLTFIDCAWPGYKARAEWTANATETYWIQLGGVWGATGSYVLTVGAGTPECPGPANNCFENAMPVVAGSSTTGSNAEATTETWEPLPCGDMSTTVWFRFDAPATAMYTADTLGSTFGPDLAIYTGDTLRTLTFLGCSSSASGDRVSWQADAGTTYWIQLGGNVGSTGDYVMRLHEGA